MSKTFYGLGGLRFWDEREIMLRNQAIECLTNIIRSTLVGVNAAWQFARVEGPVLTPRRYIPKAYSDDDLFTLTTKLGDDVGCLRAETTASSYLYMTHLLRTGRAKLPFCVWQAGKSYRRESNDGASASKLRFNEFWQIEFQCAYNNTTKADYRTNVMPIVAKEIGRLIGVEYRVVESDRLPAYSNKTDDIEVLHGKEWREIASISTRIDFPILDVLVLEVAIGLDRIISISGEI